MKTIVEIFEPYQNIIGWITVIATIIVTFGVIITQLISSYNPENVNKITYSSTGKFGRNILNLVDGDTISAGMNYSLQTILPIQQKIKIELTPGVFTFPISNSEWTYFPQSDQIPYITFQSDNRGINDSQAYMNQGVCEIRIYENESTTPIIKTITVNE